MFYLLINNILMTALFDRKHENDSKSLIVRKSCDLSVQK